MNKSIDLGIIEISEQSDNNKINDIDDDSLIENNNSQNEITIFDKNDISREIEVAMRELNVDPEQTLEELFDECVREENRILYQSVRLGVMYMAVQNGLRKIGDSEKNTMSARADTTFSEWFERRGLTRGRVYEKIALAKTYIAIPEAQRKKYIALSQIKATKLASLEPEVIKEIAEQEPNKLDEFALMSRSELKAEIDKLKKRVTCQDVELENRDAEIAHLSSKKRMTTWHPRTEDVRAECLALKAESELGLNSLYKLFEEVVDNDSALPEQEFRISQIIVTVQTLNAVMTDINEKISAIIPKEDWPNGIKAENFMSPDEAQKWLQDYRLIESRHDARKAARELAREAEKPRGRGRPKTKAQ